MSLSPEPPRDPLLQLYRDFRDQAYQAKVAEGVLSQLRSVKDISTHEEEQTRLEWDEKLTQARSKAKAAYEELFQLLHRRAKAEDAIYG